MVRLLNQRADNHSKILILIMNTQNRTKEFTIQKML